MNKAYSYVRMSTETQAQRGESLRRQLSASEDYARKKGLQLVDYQGMPFHDLGVSAFKGANTATGHLGRFLKAVEAGSIEKGSYLLVESLDRLSRNEVFDALTQLTDIIRQGIVVVTLLDGMEYSRQSLNEQGGLKLIVSLAVMSRAHDESLTKSRRLAAAWENKRANAGEKKLTKMIPGWLKLTPDRKSFDLVPDRVELVRQIFEDSKNGMGTIAITKRLNQRGLTTWRFGKKGWQRSMVTKILTGRAVLGEYAPYRKIEGRREALEPIQNYYPSIISEDLYYAAKAARESRRGRGGRKGPGLTNLFSTLIACGYCGRPIHIQNKGPKPKGGVYLRCDGALRALGCTSPGWDYSHFETNFLSLVTEVDVALVQDGRAAEKTKLLIRERDAERAKAGEIQERQAKILALVESGGTADPLKSVLKRLQDLETAHGDSVKRITRLEGEIKAAAIDQRSSEERRKQLRELLDAQPGLVDSDRFALRARLAQLVREVVDGILLFPNGGVSRSASRIDIERRLQQAGYDEKRVNETFALQDSVEEDERRTYFVSFRSGHFRLITPHPDHPATFKAMTISDSSGERWMNDLLDELAEGTRPAST